jgi:hypothetical protein
VKVFSVYLRPVKNAQGIYAIDSDPGIAPVDNQILMDVVRFFFFCTESTPS